MTFNSEVIVINNTLDRGSISGKRIRINGTTGKLYATADLGYVFKHWVDNATGQVLSTANPLIITDWRSLELEAVFDHLILTTQFYQDRDALETETYNLEYTGEWLGPNGG